MKQKLENKSMCKQKTPEYLNGLCKKLLKLNDDSKVPIFSDQENCIDKIIITETKKAWKLCSSQIHLKVFPCSYRIKTINKEVNYNGNENKEGINTNKDKVSPIETSGPGKDEPDSNNGQPSPVTNNDTKVSSDKPSLSNGEMNASESNKNQIDLRSDPSNEKSCSSNKCKSDRHEDERKVGEDESNSSNMNNTEKESNTDNPTPTIEKESVKNELRTADNGTKNTTQKEEVHPTSDDKKESEDEIITSQKAAEGNENDKELSTDTKKDGTAALANGNEVSTSKDETGLSASKNQISTVPDKQEDEDLEKLPIHVFFISEAYKLKNKNEEAYLTYVPLSDDVELKDETIDRSTVIKIETKFIKKDVPIQAS